MYNDLVSWLGGWLVISYFLPNLLLLEYSFIDGRTAGNVDNDGCWFVNLLFRKHQCHV
jgi:hypothetical protein